MRVKRNGLTYAVLVIFTVILGLSTRYFAVHLPRWVNLYLGDILWALMVFFFFGFIFKAKQSRWVAAMALIFSFGIEISQLYHAEWIDTIRSTRLGGLVLGYGFLWSDLISYSVGISAGVLLDRLIISNCLKGDNE